MSIGQIQNSGWKFEYSFYTEEIQKEVLFTPSFYLIIPRLPLSRQYSALPATLSADGSGACMGQVEIFIYVYTVLKVTILRRWKSNVDNSEHSEKFQQIMVWLYM